MGKVSKAAQIRKDKSKAALQRRYKKQHAAAEKRKRRAPACTPRKRVRGEGSAALGGAAGAAAAPQPQRLPGQKARLAPPPLLQPQPQPKDKQRQICNWCTYAIGQGGCFPLNTNGAVVCLSCRTGVPRSIVAIHPLSRQVAGD